MRILIASLMMCWFLKPYAQEQMMVFEDTINDHNFIKITSYNTYSSNRFNNEFIDKFLFGGDISTELKDANSARLKGRNVLGGEVEQQIESYTPGINLFKREDYGLKLSFSDNHYFSANITRDLYNTVMYGNANYIGDTMDFTYSSLQYLHYQKFGIGFYHQHNMSSIQINYVAGSKAIKAGLNETWMYSRSDLDTIDIAASGNMFKTNRLFPYWAFQGNGFAIDINYNFIFEGKVKNRQIINFKINNLGMIFWNKNTNKYFVNTNATYTGFDVQDFLDDDTTGIKVDWKDTLGVNEYNERQIDVLPFELVVQKLPDQGIDAKWQAIFGFKAIMVPNYFPYIFAGAYFKASDKFSISSRVSFGGFAGFRWGMNFNYWVKDKVYLALGTYDIIGLASKKIGYGRGLNFSMYFKM